MGAMVLSLQMNGEKCQERQPAVAINWRWQPTSGGNQPAVTVETVLPSATLRCGAVSNDRAESSDVEALVLSLQSGKVLLAAQLTILRLGRFNKKNALTLTRCSLRAMTAAHQKRKQQHV